METITEESYRAYLVKRLDELVKLADLELSVDQYLKVAEQMDYIMFQLFQIDAEPE